MGSYRPIALTCLTCKLMERIILRRITFHLLNHNMLPQEQYGSRKGHSAIDQILYFVQRTLVQLSIKNFSKGQLLESTKTPTYLGFTLDTEVNCSKHINRLCEKGRKRLQLLKYISGRDWRADAGTLKITYTALIRPILEYGYQIYQVAASTNLKNERIQFSVARIITGLRHSCPNDIVCYETDLQPFTLRRK
ncbi:putative RNA-directed DNA polymerase from transposon BS [Caerostris extrusa]|uniref:RNA-directed DNA polymerase from transposon BS n=1 Tax=Caerostris extrusa TaxID=172846 RepID=A0AAV4PA40_CAEEX|nr:putative RNA-directed DNA polymerase from transposon BS [Caerostris extrusa]